MLFALKYMARQMKKVLIFALVSIFTFTISAQTTRTDLDLSNYGVTISADKRLITVLTSLEIAGIDTQLGKRGDAFRAEVRNDFKGISPDLRQRLRLFVQQFVKRRPGISQSEAISPFVSLAYSMSPAPALDAPERSLDLPDELLEVLDYSNLVREFYKSPGTAAKIDIYYGSYEKIASDLRPSAKEMVLEVLDYLHTRPELLFFEKIKTETSVKGKKKKIETIETREFNRSFQIVPEKLAPRSTVNFLNIRDKYIAVVSPETDLSSSDVRRAYLQFVLDPLVLKNARSISSHRGEIKTLLDGRRKAGKIVSPDTVLAVSRSLVAAADAREEEFRRKNLATSQARKKIELLENEEQKKAVVAELERVSGILEDERALQLSEAYENGAVLVFYFAEKLKGIEDSGFDIATSLKDWIAELDVVPEKTRLEENKDARARALAERDKRRTTTVIETSLVTNPLTEALLRIDNDIEAKSLSKAEKDLDALLKKYPSGAARIYYSLGRVASKSAEGLEESKDVNVRLIKAKGFFEKVLDSATTSTDGELISLTYVSLGRIYEFYDQNEYAVKLYETAMMFGSVDGEGFKKAFDAKRKLIENN